MINSGVNTSARTEGDSGTRSQAIDLSRIDPEAIYRQRHGFVALEVDFGGPESELFSPDYGEARVIYSSHMSDDGRNVSASVYYGAVKEYLLPDGVTGREIIDRLASAKDYYGLDDAMHDWHREMRRAGRI